MHKRLAMALFAALILALFSLPSFGEGEWEDPSRAESQSETNDNVTEIAQVTAETVEDDRPSQSPLADTFPVVHAEQAGIPRPRNPQRILEAVDTEELAEKLAADRLLLSEIRKDVPEAIEEAVQYLDRLEELTARSDPTRLVQLFERVLDQAPIYFEWLETDYESQDEQITEYYVGGARGFSFAMDNFKSAVFFVIMNRLDIASRVISELD